MKRHTTTISLHRSIPGVAILSLAALGTALGAPPQTTVIDYDTFGGPAGYTLADYQAKWSNPYGLGEMDPTAHGDTRLFDNQNFFINAAPFLTSFDFSVFDHIKYFAVSNEAFAVPELGSVTFSIDIKAEAPGTIPGYIVNGVYTQTGVPYSAAVLEGQQAGATLHMIDFATGQLFDWFISGNTAFTLIERLPSNVTNPFLMPSDPAYVGREKMHTQIIDEVAIEPGVAHTVSITYTRGVNKGTVEFFLNGKRVSKVDQVGVPLDVQREKYTGIYPSLGSGEPVHNELNHVFIGHGVFSLLDAFPFQHPEAPELNVSIPVENRIFGQGVRASFDNVRVIIQNQAGN